MPPKPFPDIQSFDPNVKISPHEVSDMIDRYATFEELLQANTAVAGITRRESPQGEEDESSLERYLPVVSDSPASCLEAPAHGPVVAVIPAYNEEIAIGSVVLRTRTQVDHVVVVDDGSTDRTFEIAVLAGAEVLRHPTNLGKAQALMKGFARAKDYSPAAVVALDGDGQHNPAEIPDLIKPILDHAADLVIGSRYLNNRNDIPAYRILGQKTLDLATNLGSGIGCSDTQSGFRALSRTALDHLDFFSEGYNIESDMLEHFAHRGLVIGEVPIGVNYTIANGHKKDALSHGIDVLSHIIGLVGYKRPLISFGVPGFLLTLIGIAAFFYTFTEYFAVGSFHIIVFIIGITALILGLLLMTTSLILNSLVLAGKGENPKTPFT